AAVGCASSVASGASCGSGALSGAVGSALSPLTSSVFQNPQENIGDRIGATVVSAAAGGLASVAGGGKFANGAVTAAFGYLFNAGVGAISRGVNAMLDGQDAHRALQDWLEQQRIPGLFTESGFDGQGTSFLGRVDIGNSISQEIWEIKPNNLAGYFAARVAVEFYSLTSIGLAEYGAGATLPLPGEQLFGQRGSYVYVNAGKGAILWSSYRTATQGVSLSTVTNGNYF